MENFKQMLITIAVLLCSITVNAYDFEVDGIYYKIISSSDNTVEVTYGGSEYIGEVVVPSTISYNSNVLTVTSIGGSAFSDCLGLTSVIIGDSVTSIGSFAFWNCSGLTNVVIPNSVTRIGANAFMGCSGLTNVVIPNSVIRIECDAFRNCSRLTSVVIPNSVISIESDTFYGCSRLTSVVIGNSVTSIGNDTFKNCSRLTSVVIGNSVTSIEGSAFENCSGLTNVVIPNSVIRIESYAFENCFGLTSVVIGNSVTRIEESAFRNCNNLKTIINFSTLPLHKGSSDYGYVAINADLVINAPNGAIVGDFVFSTKKGKHALAGYFGNETDLTFPVNYNGENYDIGAEAFRDYYRHITSVVIPNSVNSIGGGAFFNCSGLTSVVIGDSVTSIGSSAFENCSGLTSVVIPNSVTSIGGCAFEGCSGLTSVVIGNSVTSIGYAAFSDCRGLTGVVIGNSVTSIEGSAFKNCSGLTSIHLLGETPPTVGRSNFTYNQYTDITIYVPVGSLKTYQTADNWKNFQDIREEDVTEISDVEVRECTTPVITCNNGTINICGGKDGAEVAIYTPSGVAIGNATITNGNATISTELANGEIVVVNIAGKVIKLIMQ